MRFLIDATPLLLRSAGVKTYTYYWAESLLRQAGPDEILTLPRFSTLPALNHEGSMLGPLPTYFTLGITYLANSLSAIDLMDYVAPRSDVFHVSNQLRNPPKSRRISATIHDMTSRLMPELHTPANIRADESFARNILHRAAGLIAVSENTKSDAVRLLGLDPQRVEVIYSGVPEVYFGAKPGPAARPYVLFLGTIEPRKNVDTLLDAWQASRLRDAFDLLLAGPRGWNSEKTFARLSAKPAGVRYLGYVAEDRLPGLTTGATAFVYPSLYEGFGFPVAQAMAAGVPVITSNTSCLPEVAGGGALLVDPRSQGELQAALEKLLTSPSLQKELASAGSARAREHYRWDVCARRSLEFFRRLAG